MSINSKKHTTENTMESKGSDMKSTAAAAETQSDMLSGSVTSYLLNPQMIPLPNLSPNILTIPQTCPSSGKKTQKSGIVEQETCTQRQQTSLSGQLSLPGSGGDSNTKSRKSQSDTGHQRQTLTIRQILERKEAALQEQERLRLSQQQQEQERLRLSQQQEQERLRLSQQQQDQERLRLSQQQEEQERLRLSQQQQEQERLRLSQQQQQEQERLRLSQQQQEQERLRLSQQQEEQERLRLSQQQLEQENLHLLQQEQESLRLSQQQQEQEQQQQRQQQLQHLQQEEQKQLQQQNLKFQQQLLQTQKQLQQEQQKLKFQQLQQNDNLKLDSDTATVTIHHFSDNPKQTTKSKLVNIDTEMILRAKEIIGNFTSSSNLSNIAVQRPVDLLQGKNETILDVSGTQHLLSRVKQNILNVPVVRENDKVGNDGHIDSMSQSQTPASNRHLQLLSRHNNEMTHSVVSSPQNIAPTSVSSSQPITDKDYPNIAQYLRPMSHVLPPLIPKNVPTDMPSIIPAMMSQKGQDKQTVICSASREPDNSEKKQTVSVKLTDIFPQKSVTEKQLSTGEVFKSAFEGLTGELIGVTDEEISDVEMQSIERMPASVAGQDLSHFSAVISCQGENWNPHLIHTLSNVSHLTDSAGAHNAVLPLFTGRVDDTGSSAKEQSIRLQTREQQQTFGEELSNADIQKLQVLGLAGMSQEASLPSVVDTGAITSIAASGVPLCSDKVSSLHVKSPQGGVASAHFGQQEEVTSQVPQDLRPTVSSQVIQQDISMVSTPLPETGTLPKIDTIRRSALPDPMEQIRQLRQASDCTPASSMAGNFVMLGTMSTGASACYLSGSSSTETVFTSVSRLYGDSQLSQSRVNEHDQVLVNVNRDSYTQYSQGETTLQEPQNNIFQNSSSSGFREGLPVYTTGTLHRPTSCPPSMNIGLSGFERVSNDSGSSTNISHENDQMDAVVKMTVDDLQDGNSINISDRMNVEQFNTLSNINQSDSTGMTLSSNQATEVIDIQVEITPEDSVTNVGSKNVPFQKDPDFDIMLKQWFSSYPWLAFDVDASRFHCSICFEGGMNSVIDLEKGRLEDLTNQFLLHENSREHKDIVKLSMSDKLVLMGISRHAEQTLQSPNNKETDQIFTSASITDQQGETVDTYITNDEREICYMNADQYFAKNVDSGLHPVFQKLKSSWFTTYTWLVLDIQKEELYCKICRHVGKKNIFSKGKSIGHPRRCEIHQHSTTIDHQDALTLYSSQNRDQGLPQRSESHQQTVQSSTEDLPNSPATSVKHSLRKKSNRRQSAVLTDDDIDKVVLDVPHDRRGPQKRRIQVHWFTDFPWLHYSPKYEAFYCTWCIKAKNSNVFTTGKLADNPKKDTFCKHESSSEHQMAAKSYAISSSDQTNVNEHAEMDGARLALTADTRALISKSGIQVEDNELAFAVPVRVDGNIKVDVPCNKRGPLNRRIKPHWFAEYKWLTFDHEKDKFFCKFCVNAEVDSILTKGKPADNPKKDTFAKHEATIDHQLAGQLYEKMEAQGTLQKLVQTIPKPIDNAEVSLDIVSESVIEEEESSQMVSECTDTSTVNMECEDYSNISADVAQQPEPVPAEKSADTQQDQIVESSSDTDSTPWQLYFWGQASSLRSCGALCDITLSTMSSGGRIVQHKAHKLILVCASDYFRNLYVKNDLQDSYHFSSLTSKGLETVLGFVYGDNIKGSQKVFSEAYEAACVLCIPKARELFQQLMSLSGSGEFSPAKLQDVVQQTRAIESTAPTFLEENNEASNDDSNNLQTYVRNIILPSLEEPVVNTAAESYQQMADAVCATSQQKEVVDIVKEPVSEKKQSSDENVQVKSEKASTSTKTLPHFKQTAFKSKRSSSWRERKKLLVENLPSCDICGKRFLKRESVMLHKEKRHKKELGLISQEPHLYKCDHCPRTYARLSSLKIHRRNHTGERPYLCTVCGKTFTQRVILQQHSVIHSNSEKPLKCETCGKKFRKSVDLNRHIIGIHSGKKPFQCEQCGMAFSWRASLVKHLHRHAGPLDRPYQCDQCDVTFVRKFDLQRHQVTHTKAKPFRCAWCFQTFTQKGSMVKHVKDHCKMRVVLLPKDDCGPG